MHLWNEYEGKTVAGAYTLGKLLRSEGRNGFFATADKAGHSAVIRLTEAHFDEEEQLQRWRQVAEVHQSNLIEIERVGKTTFDGVALTYALMEPDDANLGDVLKERPLTAAEALEVAKGVLAAMTALHASGLVHEHIEPSNVLAVGEVVKLRSDCVRECVADSEFPTPEGCAELRRRDLHDYGLLLLRCLTLEREYTATVNLPEPFRRVVPRALDGSWTAEQIAAVLDPGAAMPKPVPPVASAPSVSGTGSAPTGAAARLAAAAAPAGAVPGTAARVPLSTADGSAAESVAAAGHAGSSTVRSPLVPEGVRQEAAAGIHRAQAEAERREEVPVQRRARYAEPEVASPRLSPAVTVVLCAAAVLLLVLLGWHFFAGKAATRTDAAVPARQAAVPQAAALAPTPVSPEAPGPSTVTAAPAATDMPTAADGARVAHGSGWYVIAFTYNRQDQAEGKARRVGERHPGLNPQVISPWGHAPYLVSLGGAMGRDEAEATWRRARRDGMPRDTFVRHY